MTKMKKLLTMMLAALMCVSAVALTACGGGSKGSSDSEFYIWSAAADVDFIRREARAFVESQGWNMNVRVTAVEEDEVEGKLSTAIEIGADIMSIPIDKVADFARDLYISPFNLDIEEDLKNGENKVSAASLAGGTVGDTLFAVPYSAETYFLYYNKAVYSNINSNTTLDSLMSGTNKVSVPFDVAFYGASAFLSHGASFLKASGSNPDRIEFAGGNNDTKGIEVLKAVQAYYKNTNFVRPGDGGAAMASLMKNKSISAAVTGVWVYESMASALGNDLGIAALPKITIAGTTKNWVSFENYKYYAINAGNRMSSEKHSRCELLSAHLASAEVQNQRFVERGNVPTNLALQASIKAGELNEDIKDNPSFKNIFDMTMTQLENSSLNNPPSSLWKALEVGMVYNDLKDANDNTITSMWNAIKNTMSATM